MHCDGHAMGSDDERRVAIADARCSQLAMLFPQVHLLESTSTSCGTRTLL